MIYECSECEAIALEINDAFREAWESKDQRFRDACASAYNLLGGTEEELEWAEEVLQRFKPEQSLSELLTTLRLNPNLLRAGHAVRQKLIHDALTGHRIPIKTTPRIPLSQISFTVLYKHPAIEITNARNPSFVWIWIQVR